MDPDGMLLDLDDDDVNTADTKDDDIDISSDTTESSERMEFREDDLDRMGNGEGTKNDRHAEETILDGEVLDVVKDMISKVEKFVAREKERHYHCLNGHCDGKSIVLSPADGSSLYYYGYAKGERKKFVCEVCKKRVTQYKDEIMKCLEERRPFIEVPTPFRRPENVIIDDIDIEEDERRDDSAANDEEAKNPDESNVIYIVPANFEEIVAEQLKALNIDEQKELCKAYLRKAIAEEEESIATLAEQVKLLEDKIEEGRAQFNKLTSPEYNITYIQPLDINEYGVVKIGGSAASKKNYDFKRPLTVSKASCSSQTAPEVIVEEQKKKHSAVLKLAPTPDVIPKIMPKIGDKVYAMKHSSLHYWLPSRVIGTRTNMLNEVELRVEFKTNKRGRPITDPKTNPKDIVISSKIMSPKHVAFNLPCPFVLPVGTRVIARFTEDNRPAAFGSGDFYVGIVAEPPRPTNHFRYLVFFDDGYAQYVGQMEVLLVCSSAQETWKEVHPDSKEFIKQYLATYPEKAMHRLQQGSTVTAELNGRWYLTKVLEVDDSLARIQFGFNQRVEWIYRGSARLYPIYSKLKRNHDISSVLPIRNKLGDMPIQGQRAEVATNVNKTGQLARKSSAHPPPARSQGSVKEHSFKTSTVNLPNSRFGNSSTVTYLAEYEGRLDIAKIPSDRPRPAPYTQHECGPNCVKPFVPLCVEVCKINPLLQPLHVGFDREVGNSRSFVHYRAPCGLRLRDYDELQEFLTKTKYNMGIEYFCFDLDVKVDHEFIPARKMFVIRDLSYGKEKVPVSCINSIDHDYPDFVSYTSHRLPGKDVKLNLDDDFLTCCDCTDDCLDKDKCSCWQLTIEGTSLIGSEYNLEVGYQYRRLHDHVITGIYECNQRCKCQSTCSNRVVQNPMKWQLQVFKTSTKGWAIRPLNDIPTGSFICVYVGQLLSENCANEDGKNFGDEYLAELDYIEVIDQVKEGYEDDVIEPGEPQPGPSRGRSNVDPDYEIEFDSEDEEFGTVCMRQNVQEEESSDEELSRRRPSRFAPRFNPTQERKTNRKATRELFGPEEHCYIMDAKSIGNIGRYLNHSCEPNVFVQNVFVDSHDIRFPWVCFFAYKHIRAGTELTWDYNYDIGSVPGKSMYCYCAMQDCRGRLL